MRLTFPLSSRAKIFLSLVLTTILFAISLLLNDFHYHVNDDLVWVRALNGYYTGDVTVDVHPRLGNRYLLTGLSLVNIIFNTNIFMLYVISIVVIGTYILNIILFQHLKSAYAFPFSILMFFIAVNKFFVEPTFTFSAYFGASIGLLGILSLEYKKQPITVILSSILFVGSCLLRYYVLIIIIPFLIIYLLINYKYSFKKANIRLLIVSSAILSVLLLSNHIYYYTSNNWDAFIKSIPTVAWHNDVDARNILDKMDDNKLKEANITRTEVDMILAHFYDDKSWPMSERYQLLHLINKQYLWKVNLISLESLKYYYYDIYDHFIWYYFPLTLLIVISLLFAIWRSISITPIMLPIFLVIIVFMLILGLKVEERIYYPSAILVITLLLIYSNKPSKTGHDTKYNMVVKYGMIFILYSSAVFASVEFIEDQNRQQVSREQSDYVDLINHISEYDENVFVTSHAITSVNQPMFRNMELISAYLQVGAGWTLGTPFRKKFNDRNGINDLYWDLLSRPEGALLIIHQELLEAYIAHMKHQYDVNIIIEDYYNIDYISARGTFVRIRSDDVISKYPEQTGL